jgi:hypothetical protein
MMKNRAKNLMYVILAVSSAVPGAMWGATETPQFGWDMSGNIKGKQGKVNIADINNLNEIDYLIDSGTKNLNVLQQKTTRLPQEQAIKLNILMLQEQRARVEQQQKQEAIKLQVEQEAIKNLEIFIKQSCYKVECLQSTPRNLIWTEHGNIAMENNNIRKKINVDDIQNIDELQNLIHAFDQLPSNFFKTEKLQAKANKILTSLKDTVETLAQAKQDTLQAKQEALKQINSSIKQYCDEFECNAE